MDQINRGKHGNVPTDVIIVANETTTDYAEIFYQMQRLYAFSMEYFMETQETSLVINAWN